MRLLMQGKTHPTQQRGSLTETGTPDADHSETASLGSKWEIVQACRIAIFISLMRGDLL